MLRGKKSSSFVPILIERISLSFLGFLFFSVVVITSCIYRLYWSPPPGGAHISSYNGKKSIVDWQGALPPERFLWYAPSGGFGNQVISFRHALIISALLNRTLIIPPIFQHFQVEAGDCGSAKLASPEKLNRMSWKVAVEKIHSQYYFSIADVIDITKFGTVKSIDFRHFLAANCHVDVSASLNQCEGCEEWKLRLNLTDLVSISQRQRSRAENDCGRRVGGVHINKKMKRRFAKNALHTVTRNCRDTIFTTRSEPTFDLGRPSMSCNNRQMIDQEIDAVMSSMMLRRHQPNLPDLRFFRLLEELTVQGSKEERAEVLSMGSTFHYFDIWESSGDKLVDNLRCKSIALGFTKPILQTAKMFVGKQIGGDFTCFHHRGGDGPFLPTMNETWRSMLAELTQTRATQKGKMKLFLMTGVTTAYWLNLYRSSLEGIGYDIIFSSEVSSLVQETLQNLLLGGRKISTNDLETHGNLESKSLSENEKLWLSNGMENVQMFLEVAVCSCSTLGFVYDKKSTLSRFVNQLRESGACFGS